MDAFGQIDAMDAFGRIDVLRAHFAAVLANPEMRLSDFGVFSDCVYLLYALVNDRYWELKAELKADVANAKSPDAKSPDPLHS